MGFLSKFLNKDQGSQQTPSMDNLDIPPPPEFNADIPKLQPEQSQASQPQAEVPPIEPPAQSNQQAGQDQETGHKQETIPRPQVPDPEAEIAKRREEVMNSDEPLFTKVEDYKKVVDASNDMKMRLKECESILQRLNEIRLEADREHTRWKSELLDIYKKFSYVDKVISELEQ